MRARRQKELEELNRFFIKHFPTQRTQLNSGEGNKEKPTKNHLKEDSPAFLLNLRIPASLKKKTFTQSVRANELHFSALEKKYTI